MANFQYKAVGPSGAVIEGETEAVNRAAVFERLQEMGQTPLRADEIKVLGARGLTTRDLFGKRRVSRKHIGLLTRELSVLLNAGLPLERAFTVLIGLSPDRDLRDLLGEVLDAVRGGTPLADALAQHGQCFPPYYVSMVRAGEAGGALETVLARLADHLEKSQALHESVRSALIYPAILLFMTVMSIVMLMTVVIPEFESLFEDAGDALPLATRVVLAAGGALSDYWWAMGGAILALIWAVHRALKVPSIRLSRDRLALRAPLVGDLISKLQVARFSRTLGTLMQNGVSLLNALAIVRDSLGNGALTQAVDGVAAHLREGRGMAGPMAEAGVFPELAVQLVSVGEETGELPTMLAKVADIFDREVQLTIDRLVAILVPALTMGLGLIIAGIIGSVVLAFLSVNDLAF